MGEEGLEQGPFFKGFEAPGQSSCTSRGSMNRISDIQGIAEALELIAGRCLELDHPSLSQAILQALTDHAGRYRESPVSTDCDVAFAEVAAK